MAFAEGTKVASDQTRLEIERTLVRYGAKGFGYVTEGNRAVVMFEMRDRRIRFVVDSPSIEKFRLSPSRRVRNHEAACEALAGEMRRRWRALLLVIKAKLEAAEDGISCFEEEFLAHIVLPDGQTVGEAMRPQISHAYATGQMPPLLGYSPRPAEISAEAARG